VIVVVPLISPMLNRWFFDLVFWFFDHSGVLTRFPSAWF